MLLASIGGGVGGGVMLNAPVDALRLNGRLIVPREESPLPGGDLRAADTGLAGGGMLGGPEGYTINGLAAGGRSVARICSSVKCSLRLASSVTTGTKSTDTLLPMGSWYPLLPTKGGREAPEIDWLLPNRGGCRRKSPSLVNCVAIASRACACVRPLPFTAA